MRVVCIAIMVLLLLLIAVPAAGQVPPALALDAWTPPPCAGLFSDVPCSSPFAPWIEQLARDGVATECGPGRYCPKVPLTREEAAVLLERAMRGTATWPGFGEAGGGGLTPAHTVLVSAVVTSSGAPDALASGQALLSGLAAIPTGADAPSAENRWLVIIGPGVFDLGDRTLTMREWVNVEGVGEEATIIRSSAAATALAASSSSLGRLRLDNTGRGTSLHVGPMLTDSRVEQVTLRSACLGLDIESDVRLSRLRVSGGLPAVRVDGAFAQISESEVIGRDTCAEAGTWGAVTVWYGSGVELSHSRIDSEGTAVVTIEGTVRLSGCSLSAATSGVAGSPWGWLRAEDSTIRARRTGVGDVQATLRNVRIEASGYGIAFVPLPPAELHVQGGEISGSPASVFVGEGGTGFFSGTVLANGVVTDGWQAESHCAGVVGPGFTFSPTACPAPAGA